MIGYRGRTYLFEVKNTENQYGRGGLNPNQARWHAGWRGQVATVKSIHEALDVLESEVEENARLNHEIRNLQQILVAAGDLYPEIARLLKGDE